MAIHIITNTNADGFEKPPHISKKEEIHIKATLELTTGYATQKWSIAYHLSESIKEQNSTKRWHHRECQN